MSLYLRDKLNLSASFNFSLSPVAARPACLAESLYNLCTVVHYQVYLACTLIVQLYRMYRKGVNYCKTEHPR